MMVSILPTNYADTGLATGKEIHIKAVAVALADTTTWKVPERPPAAEDPIGATRLAVFGFVLQLYSLMCFLYI